MIHKYFLSTFFYFFSFLSIFGQTNFTLGEAIQYGLQHSNAVKLKSIAINDANAQIKEYKAIGIPKVNGTISYQHYLALPAQPVADFITPSVYSVLFKENVIPSRDLGAPELFKFSFFQPNVLTGGLEASSLLFDGAYLYGIKASKLYKDLAQQDQQVTEYNTKVNITKAYAAVLIAHENETILNNNITVLTKSLKEIKAMYDNGFAEALDVDRLQLSYDRVLIDLDRVNQQIELTKNMLKYAMNYPLDSEIVLSDDLQILMKSMVEEDLAMDNKVDVNRRPEYGLLKLNQMLNDIDLKRTKAGYLPTARAFINAQANLQRQNLFDNTQSGWIPQSALGLSINVPIYDGGEKAAKISRIKLRMEKSVIDQQDFEIGMNLQVKNASLSYENMKKITQNRKKAVEVNEQIYNKTIIKFKEGVGSSVEVKQAETSLYQAQGEYTNALYDLLSAKISLNSALGKF